ncbi:MAG TPA: hypothetical protein VMT53_20700 [Terriglobales bacterium]|nr:hypothetical protein [Terriglobales bacterium]
MRPPRPAQIKPVNNPQSKATHSVTVTVTDPVPPLLVAVIVAWPVPTRVAEPAEGVVITLVLLELQVAEPVTSVPFWVAVKLTDVPLLVMLIVVPESEVTVIADDEDCPTVTVVDPLAVPEVAVMVTPLLVFAKALTRPLLLTLTWLAFELVQVMPLTLPVDPSLKFPVALICCV